MPRLLKLERHLALAEIAARHDSAPDPVTREHWRILYWLACGTKATRVAWLTGYSTKWVGRLARRYNR
ncbi:MAG: IS630 family transposase, partial [Actinomycetota bacterium]|nr:IS630 family transposase [Actinomycetota bacterium]